MRVLISCVVEVSAATCELIKIAVLTLEDGGQIKRQTTVTK